MEIPISLNPKFQLERALLQIAIGIAQRDDLKPETKKNLKHFFNLRPVRS
jgi:hypothetical protein